VSLVDIVCSGWVSDDTPLKYELRAKLDNGKYLSLPSDIDMFSRQQFTVGDKDNNYRRDVNVRIINSVGEYHDEAIDIFVSCYLFCAVKLSN